MSRSCQIPGTKGFGELFPNAERTNGEVLCLELIKIKYRDSIKQDSRFLRKGNVTSHKFGSHVLLLVI